MPGETSRELDEHKWTKLTTAHDGVKVSPCPLCNIPSWNAVVTVTGSPQPDRRDDEFVFAHARYAERRQIAHDLTTRQLRSHGLFSEEQRLTSITPDALRAYREQWRTRHWAGHGGWDWDDKARRYVRKPRSFHAAAWSGQILCGLCVGSVCRSKEHVIIQFMESAPDPDHPLRGRITEVMFGAARNYARVLGTKKIYLREPLPGLREWYESFGFSLAFSYRGRVYYMLQLP